MPNKKMKIMASQDLLQAIGAVTLNFAHLEDAISFWNGVLLFGYDAAHQNLTRIVTAELSYKQKVHLLGALYKYRFSKQNDTQLENLLKVLFKAEEERNTTIHSTWIGGWQQGTMRMKATAKYKGLKMQMEASSVEAVNLIADSISEAHWMLVDFCSKIGRDNQDA